MKKQSNPPSPKGKEAKKGGIEITAIEMQKAFTEWDRRFREDPDKFMSEAQRVLKSTPTDYGEACAPYFMELIRQVKSETIA